MKLSHPDDYDLDDVRSIWIGKLVGDATGRYPVEYDPIRRHCHMTGDRNPAFLDPEAARDGVHGAVVVPPSMLPIYFASGGPWPPKASKESASAAPDFTMGVPTIGDRGINMGVEWDFLEPIRVGDVLRLETRIADVYKKAIKLDAHAIWIVSETSIFNQHDRVVVKWRNVVLSHRSPKRIAEDEARGPNRSAGAAA